MRILQIFNRYSHVGGEEIVVAQISKDLALHHDFREITLDSREWVAESGWYGRFKQFLAMAWNPRSTRMVREEIEAFRPDVILLHNTMPVGSAWLSVFLTRSKIPLVQFIHNFRPFSVNGYCWGDGKLLPQGLKKNYLPEIYAKAWQGSRFKTAWYALLIWSLHQIGVYQRINGWIAISQFMKDTFVKGGIDARRIEVISHSWTPQCSEEELKHLAGQEQEPFFLFLGRINEEKGVRVLLAAWELFEQSSATGRLVIAGEGPLAAEAAEYCGRLDRVSFVGFQSGEAKKQLLRECTALVVPSVWWEPLGLVLYEAYDYGKPVLAARSGGIVDHVEDEITGWLHQPGDHATLAKQMLAASADRQLCRELGAAGRKLLLERSKSVWIHQFDEFVTNVIAAANTAPQPSIPSPHAQSTPQPSSPSPFPLSAAPVSALPRPLRLTAYLADQNPGHDRSFGISRMSQVVLDALAATGEVEIEAITSKTSQQAPVGVTRTAMLPWGTRRKWVRLFSDHFHPMFRGLAGESDVYYYPKGYLPLLWMFSHPAVVTIHDTIIQYDEDHYPEWRDASEYRYWSWMLKHTLLRAGEILTVSESSKKQIQEFMVRHAIPAKPITVTYEPCMYEAIEQPVEPRKENYLIHLASHEPHKRTEHLIRWWQEAEEQGRDLPILQLIGNIPTEMLTYVARSKTIVKRPFLEDSELRSAYMSAKALLLPSEIEGFGLPALEAYYLGTPVCFVKGTSVEEILGVATSKGGFDLNHSQSLFDALAEVMAMDANEVRECGLKLRETYAAGKVAERMIAVFRDLAGR